MKTKELLLFCEACGFKKITQQDNVELSSRSNVQNGIKDKTMDQPPMTKCPNCGRGVILKRLTEAYLKKNETKNQTT